MKKVAVIFCSLIVILGLASMGGATLVKESDKEQVNFFSPIDTDYYTNNLPTDIKYLSNEDIELEGLSSLSLTWLIDLLIGYLCTNYPELCVNDRLVSEDWGIIISCLRDPEACDLGGDDGEYTPPTTSPAPDTPPVPEPATMLLLGTGLICLAGVGRRKFINHN